jgi:hypothetical protein
MRTLVVTDPCRVRAGVRGRRVHALSEHGPASSGSTDRGVGWQVVLGASLSL